MITTVTLHGALAQVAGRAVWHLAVLSPGEALRAIEAQVGKLFRHLLERDQDGVSYRVLIDGEDCAHDHPRLGLPLKHYATIDFIPVPAGADGLWQTIVGALLIVVGVILYFTPAAGLAPFLVVAGIGLLAGGIMQMFFGPKPPVTASHQSSDRGGGGAVSYLFNGPVNTVNQGGPVPLLYGHMIVGSTTISSGIRTASLALVGDGQTAADRQRDLKDAMNMPTSDQTNRAEEN